MKNRWYNIFSIAAVACCFTACSEEMSTGGDDAVNTNDIINIGIDADGLTGSSDADMAVTTRAAGDAPTPTRTITRAEDVEWLKPVLKNGLDITYSNMDADMNHVIGNEKVAILKWSGNKDSNSGRGIYSFNYKGETKDVDGNQEEVPAQWYDNGPHYFEGVHVPADIRTTGTATTAQNLTREQWNDEVDGNYTLLNHYIGMPPSWHHPATVDQILLPFKHRLSRVIVYVLIDPQLNTQIEGYNCELNGDGVVTTKDDPKTTSFRFNSVKVLDHVQEVAATKTTAAKLTPIWSNDGGITRKVIPHFLDEVSCCITSDGKTLAAKDEDAQKNFIVYEEKATQKKLHPREEKWAEAHAAYLLNEEASGYIQSKYQRVPIYDIIVRPTYTEPDSVMYDEANYYNADKTKNATRIESLCNETNSIDFEMTLESGLTYAKHFEFDLNANWQTVVYLTIDREGVDYDASTSEKWEAKLGNDGYYGPNNDLGHNLSMAGSSWQRAYRNSKKPLIVTDGNEYDESQNLGQYVSDAAWIEHFAQAYEGGANHGDYFVLDKNISIDASKLPQNFVFTGHLDARGYTITFIGSGDWATSTLYNEEHLYKSKDESDEFHLPTLYIPNEIAQAKGHKSESIGFGDDMMIKVVGKSLYEIMHNDVVYYYKEAKDDYRVFVRPEALYRKNPTSLFAGLNAEYRTKQEDDSTLDHKFWEANVHMEKNNGKTYWVPLPGYRAEILNTRLSGGSFFPNALPNAAVTGYIYNCFEDSTPIKNNPAIPEY